MNYLGLSTSYLNSTFALEADGILTELSYDKNDNFICERIINIIDSLITKSKIDRTSLTAIGVDFGPGSFTGIRIGIATANAIAIALRIPVYSFSSLDLLALRFFTENPDNKKDRIRVGINAGRKEVYTAGYEYENGNLLKTETDNLISLDQFNAFSREIILTGYGFEESLENFHEIFPEARYCIEFLKKTDLSSYTGSYTVPNYVKLCDAEIMLNKIEALRSKTLGQ
ncbi:MAG: YdiC [uncultured bacterium]|nr:MAG: YdiC [uncultured bacterium]